MFHRLHYRRTARPSCSFLFLNIGNRHVSRILPWGSHFFVFLLLGKLLSLLWCLSHLCLLAVFAFCLPHCVGILFANLCLAEEEVASKIFHDRVSLAPILLYLLEGRTKSSLGRMNKTSVPTPFGANILSSITRHPRSHLRLASQPHWHLSSGMALLFSRHFCFFFFGPSLWGHSPLRLKPIPKRGSSFLVFGMPVLVSTKHFVHLTIVLIIFSLITIFIQHVPGPLWRHKIRAGPPAAAKIRFSCDSTVQTTRSES